MKSRDHCAGTVGGFDDEDINDDDLIDEQVRAAEEHEAEEALALADAISTHCADDTFPRGGFYTFRGGSQGGFNVGESEERGGQKPMSKSKFL